MWQLGLCSVTFRTLSYMSILDLCARAGIDSIEWSARSHSLPGDLRISSDIRTACASYQITVASLGSYHFVNGRSSEYFKSLIDTAHSLGAPNIRVWAGECGKSSTDTDAAQRAEIVRDFRTITQMARAAGISVSIEYHRLSLSDTTASVVEIINEVDADNLFSYWQRLPGVQLSAATDELHAIGENLANIHVFNWDAARNRYPMRDAVDFWRPLLAVAQTLRLRYPAPCAMIEFVKNNDPEQFVSDARTLRSMLAMGTQQLKTDE